MFDKKKVTINATVDARKEKIDADAAWDLLRPAASVMIAKGKKVLTFTPKSDGRDDILKHAMGPSGNLRAPAILIQDRFIIGFNEELYHRDF